MRNAKYKLETYSFIFNKIEIALKQYILQTFRTTHLAGLNLK